MAFCVQSKQELREGTTEELLTVWNGIFCAVCVKAIEQRASVIM
jgi:hypothetical protein